MVTAPQACTQPATPFAVPPPRRPSARACPGSLPHRRCAETGNPSSSCRRSNRSLAATDTDFTCDRCRWSSLGATQCKSAPEQTFAHPHSRDFHCRDAYHESELVPRVKRRIAKILDTLRLQHSPQPHLFDRARPTLSRASPCQTER